MIKSDREFERAMGNDIFPSNATIYPTIVLVLNKCERIDEATSEC